MLLKSLNSWAFALLAVCLFPSISAFGGPATNQIFVASAETAMNQAWKDYLADTNSSAAAGAFARATSDFAEFATNDTQRAEIARRGIAVCRQWLAREPDSAPGHYYLGMNLGKLAQAEAPSFAAYRLVHEVEAEFKTAAKLDVKYDYAGPARTLGLLYFRAPGWPLSIGSKSKAREWLERAAALAPGYPPNQLNLAEAQLKWRQRDELTVTIKNMAGIWPAAQTNFVGESWQPDWCEWDARRAAVKADYERLYGTKP